jgi:hypothetical protein
MVIKFSHISTEFESWHNISVTKFKLVEKKQKGVIVGEI